MKRGNRTDLALEAVSSHTGHGAAVRKSRINNLPLTEITLCEDNEIGKPAGNYATLHCIPERRDEELEAEALSAVLEGFVPSYGAVLVAGLGNKAITPDSLGARAAEQVVATAHMSGSDEFAQLGMREVYVVETGVLAQTGMESAQQLRYIAGGIKPDIVIVIDSLACAETGRLGRTVQVTDTGITPGSGVGNERRELSSQTMSGIPVVAIGAPTVIDLSSVAPDIVSDTFDAMVVPRDIDNMVAHYARIIAKALNKVLLPMLSQDELERLRF